MKNVSFTKILSVLILIITFSIVSQQAAAQARDFGDGLVQQAANSCFPRVFSQIDQFKVSSGGIRNTNSSPRTIICSINFRSFGEGGGGGFQAKQVYMGFEAPLPDDMLCTHYTREVGSGMLLDSATQRFKPSSDGIDEPIRKGTNWTDTNVPVWRVYHYVQCQVPSNGRIFITRS